MVNTIHFDPLPSWLGRIYPFIPKSFWTPSGARMSYLDEGVRADEAVLMLHGNPTWSFYYRDLVRDMATRIRCIAPDHVGMGLSEKPRRYNYCLETRISDIEALVDALGLKKVHLVVHDWGGAIGFGYAAKHPEKIGKIVILNTAAFASDRMPKRIAACRFPLFGKFLVCALNGFAEPATWMATTARRLSWDERRAYLYPYNTWANRRAIHEFVKDIPLEAKHPSRPRIEAIERALPSLRDKPKMIVWGLRDFCFDGTFLSRWLSEYPEARVIKLEKAGHYVLEDAGREGRAQIADFLIKNQT